MSHHGDHWRPEFQLIWIIFFNPNEITFLERGLFDLVLELICDYSSRFKIDGLIQRSHDTECHRLLDHFTRPYSHPLRQL